MSDTKKYFTDKNYIKAYVRIESAKSDVSGFIYIESESDKSFWTEVINSCAKGKYIFKFKTKEQGKSEARGKCILEDLFATANEVALVAIDSDYDYIAPNRSDVSKKINSNKYVLQTYAYAVENIKLDNLRVDQCLSNFCFYEPNEHTVSDFIKGYSNLLYPALLKFLYLMDTGSPLPFDEHDFHSMVIPNNIADCYAKNDYSTIAELVANVDAQLGELIKDEPSFSVFTTLSHYKGMTPDNCYKFIKGHDVEDKIVSPIIKYIRRDLILKELERIKKSFEPKDVEDKLKEVKGHFERKCNIHTLINCTPHSEDDSIYNKICDHVRSINI